MRKLFAKLSSKLDALSNYHFTPRPVAEESDVKAVSAIVMEEAQPLGVATSDTVAPEEVFGGKRGRGSVLKGESEVEQAERKAQRNTKKKARRAKRAATEADEKLISKLQPGLGLNNPYEKRKVREDLARARSGGKVVDARADKNDDYNSSTKLFARLQKEGEAGGGGDTATDYKKGKSKKSSQLIM
jgi:U3 small nucleolar RNA-associated protein MPP10